MFLLLLVSALNTMYIIKLCQKQLWRNLATVNLKLKTLNYLLRVQPKFCVLAFLTFRPVFNVRPLATWLLIKKRVLQFRGILWQTP